VSLRCESSELTNVKFRIQRYFLVRCLSGCQVDFPDETGYQFAAGLLSVLGHSHDLKKEYSS